MYVIMYLDQYCSLCPIGARYKKVIQARNAVMVAVSVLCSAEQVYTLHHVPRF